MKTSELLVVAFLMGVGLWMGMGCESDRTGDVYIDPPQWTFTFGGSNDSTKVFTAYLTGHKDSSLALPLEWRVENRAMGMILSQSGSTAVYAVNEGMKGGNVIIVKDQYGNEGRASVSQQ
jgi:hypothetical protein